MSYIFNGERTEETQERDNRMRISRPDLHSMSFDGEICWLFIPIETERNIFSLHDLTRVPDIDRSVIGFKRCEYPFIEAFWAYNERNWQTDRETVKCSISDFIKTGRKYVFNCSLGRYFEWRRMCDDWSCQTDPSKQFCLVPRTWTLPIVCDKSLFPEIREEENIIGKNLADDTVVEDLDESQFFF
jgi:hypothetical protein